MSTDFQHTTAAEDRVPWNQLVFFAIIAVIVGILAAIMPARRAAKLNVLRALQYE